VVRETVPEAKGRTPVAELGVADPEERAVCGCEDAGGGLGSNDE